MITNFTNANYYVTTGKYFSRIVNPFSPTADVVQGGAFSPSGSGASGLPGTPFPNESIQQLHTHRDRSAFDG